MEHGGFKVMDKFTYRTAWAENADEVRDRITEFIKPLEAGEAELLDELVDALNNGQPICRYEKLLGVVVR